MDTVSRKLKLNVLEGAMRVDDVDLVYATAMWHWRQYLEAFGQAVAVLTSVSDELIGSNTLAAQHRLNRVRDLNQKAHDHMGTMWMYLRWLEHLGASSNAAMSTRARTLRAVIASERPKLKRSFDAEQEK